MDEIGDWDPAHFEANGRKLLRMIREHFESIRQVPVATPSAPADLVDLFATDLPDAGEEFDRVLDDTRSMVVPNLVQWNHPAFFAYFPTCASFPGVLAETLTAALNVNAMLWKTSPAASALEMTVLRWVAELVGYPPDAESLLLNGASLANLYALAVARDGALDVDVRVEGVSGAGVPRLRVYTSDQAHSSIEKAAITLGIGMGNVVSVPSDDRYRMRPDLLDAAIRADLRRGHRPVAVVATVGTTSVGAADPLAEIARVCAEHGVWLHVDAAYGGFWRAAPSLADALEDVAVGDSLVVNPQKTLFVPLEATVLMCRRRGALADTFRLVPEYLRSEEQGPVDYMDLSPQLGRSFRALKLWWVLRSFGRAGIAGRLDHSVAMARRLRDLVARDPDWRAPAPSVYPLLCLRYEPRDVRDDASLDDARRAEVLDGLNRAILAEVNGSGSAYLSHSVIREGFVLRVSLGNIHTGWDDVARLWELLNTAAAHASHRWRESMAVTPGM